MNTGTPRLYTVAPQGAPPTPDPRLLEWYAPKTNHAPRKVNLAYSTTSQTRQTYLAHQWAEPRSIGTRWRGLRLAAAGTGLKPVIGPSRLVSELKLRTPTPCSV